MEFSLDIKGTIQDNTCTMSCAFLNGLKKGDTITLVINSNGGNVTDAFGIVGAMMIAQSRGVVIKTICVGLADSCASWILAMGDKGHREVMIMASALVHPLQIRDEETGDYTSIYDVAREEANEQLFVISNQMEALISKQTGLSKQDIKKLFTANGGTGTTLTAEQLIKYGYADKLFESQQLNERVKLSIKNASNRVEVYNLMLAVPTDTILQKNKNKKHTPMETSTLMNVSRNLGIDSQSTEQEILAKISCLKNENNNIKNTLQEAKDTVEKYERERVNFLVNTAVLQGKIKNEITEINKFKNKANQYKSIDFFAKEIEDMPVMTTKSFVNLSKLGNSKYAGNMYGMNIAKNKEELLEVGNIDFEEFKEKKEDAKNDVDKRELIDEVGGFLKSKGLDDEDIRLVIKKMEQEAYENSTDEDKDKEADNRCNLSQEEALNTFEEMSEEKKENLRKKNEKVYNKLAELEAKKNSSTTDVENKSFVKSLLNY